MTLSELSVRWAVPLSWLEAIAVRLRAAGIADQVAWMEHAGLREVRKLEREGFLAARAKMEMQEVWR